MDVPLLLLVLSYIFLAAQDNIVAWYWAVRVAPSRARDLIMMDPLFVETRALLKSVEQEMEIVRHDQLSLRDSVDKALSSATREMRLDVERALKDLQRDISTMVKEKVDVVVPETELRRVTQSIQATMRKALQDGELLEGMEKVLDEKLKDLPQGGDIEAMLTDAEMSSDEGKQQSYEWMCEKGLPETFAWRAAEKGPGVVRAIAKSKGWNILEMLEGD